MKNKDLKKLSRIDLLEILVEQETEIERLKLELEEANQKLEERRMEISKIGSIAEASLKVNGVFEAAEKAAKQYLYNVELEGKKRLKLLEKQEAEYKERIERMLVETIKYCDEMKLQTSDRIQDGEDI